MAALAAAIAPACAESGACRYNSDCDRSYCAGGACKKDCIDAKVDCPPGWSCDGVAQCVAPGGGIDAGGDGAPGDDGGVDSGSGDDGSAGDGSLFGDSASDGGVLKHELDLCASDQECASPLVCRAMYVGGAPRCTRTCGSNSQCMTGTRCDKIGSSTFCAASDVGRSCASASSCNFACLTGPGYCTTTCASGADCPNGYGCMPVGSPPQSVCVRAEAYCQNGQASACIAPSACDTSIPVVSGCTLACSSASDCPQRAQGMAAWTCDGLCRRPSDVVGPIGQGDPAQYACDSQNQVVSVCNDAQHMDFTQFAIPSPPAIGCPSSTATQGAPGDACVDSCLFRGGCIFGYACTALGSIANGRIGLCLPSLGSGEVGSSCAKDADCFFGYCNRTAGKCSRDCSADGVCPSGSSCTAGGGPPVEGLPFKRCQ